MKRWSLLFMTICVTVTGGAQEILQKFGWAELSRSGVTLPGEVVEQSFLRVESTNSTGLRAALLRIESPRISGTFYAIRGEIRYEAVEGDGFLEMWNVFPPAQAGVAEGQFFSRTLGESGEMGKISGTSGMRRFVLPFDRTGSATVPSRLELNLVLPGKGVVHIGPLELVEYKSRGWAAAAGAGAWWSDRTAGWIGGIGGTLIGSLAALTSLLAARQKARSFVMGTAGALLGTGAMLAVATIVALMMRQPYGVWYPLALGAVLLLALTPSQLRGFRRQYEDHELRKMAGG